MNDLNARLQQAHAEGDRKALISLYEEAARAESTETARGFYLTHAYVFALEAGDRRADLFKEELIAMGREHA